MFPIEIPRQFTCYIVLITCLRLCIHLSLCLELTAKLSKLHDRVSPCPICTYDFKTLSCCHISICSQFQEVVNRKWKQTIFTDPIFTSECRSIDKGAITTFVRFAETGMAGAQIHNFLHAKWERYHSPNITNGNTYYIYSYITTWKLSTMVEGWPSWKSFTLKHECGLKLFFYIASVWRWYGYTLKLFST
jgi:hypothetical protein